MAVECRAAAASRAFIFASKPPVFGAGTRFTTTEVFLVTTALSSLYSDGYTRTGTNGKNKRNVIIIRVGG